MPTRTLVTSTVYATLLEDCVFWGTLRINHLMRLLGFEAGPSWAHKEILIRTT